MRLPPGPRATRRTALGSALVGLVTLTGCDPSRPASTPPGTTPAGTATDPDASLLEAVIAELDDMIALVAAAAARRPQLAADLAPFAALHLAHREVLPERSGDPASPDVAGSVDALAARVVRREQQSERRLAGWSVAAESGTLARLLASMSAGTAAHLADSGLRRAAR